MPRTLTDIWIYPIKSMRGVRLSSAEVTPRGLRDDRRWMVVANGIFLSQRVCPRMATVHVEVLPEGLRLQGTCTVETPRHPPNTEVGLWKERVAACDAGEAAAQWLSHALQTPCRLVYMPDAVHRATDPTYAPEHHVSFADGFPFLLTCRQSLADLNTRLDAAVPMDRFRPNLVVQGDEPPFVEDGWRTMSVGECSFTVVKPCARCVIVNTDQTTGARSAEPLRTLARYRRTERGAMFGQNLVATRLGTVRAGDSVQVLSEFSGWRAPQSQ